MNTRRIAILSVTLFALGLSATFAARSSAVKPAKLSHVVVFALKDHSEASRKRFLESCEKYLTNHEGLESASFGTIAEDVVEGPSDREFDVVIHLVFDSKEAEARYIEAPRHKKFVEENKEHFGKVRVFDTYLTK